MVVLSGGWALGSVRASLESVFMSWFSGGKLAAASELLSVVAMSLVDGAGLLSPAKVRAHIACER